MNSLINLQLFIFDCSLGETFGIILCITYHFDILTVSLNLLDNNMFRKESVTFTFVKE